MRLGDLVIGERVRERERESGDDMDAENEMVLV